MHDLIQHSADDLGFHHQTEDRPAMEARQSGAFREALTRPSSLHGACGDRNRIDREHDESGDDEQRKAGARGNTDESAVSSRGAARETTRRRLALIAADWCSNF